ncbi:class I SAM-dependent methyltransferase [Actinomycetospora soli]|uniref:class I SAM-dependent methyltransferase n=1 Tax=Actinomycetospora soli TaxID=2893887 RepID=UPI001E39E371|nr:class I SAM-dependent methyltransferase [Actinomycetospora soli]MCD2185649.1 class I SAM-dependent methyltransferase [Actinomycetospora soli]
MDDHLALNRANWDQRAALHVTSPDYAVDRLVADPTAISDVVAFDRPRLGDLTGLRGVHLQCHIGTDTLSLARLGAEMVGVDLSPVSVDHARRTAERAGVPIEYLVSDVYAAPEALSGRTFDLVYTGIGALNWLPSIERWADVVVAVLAPGGRLLLREMHPALGAIDETVPGQLVVGYPWFETVEPLVFDDATTYVAAEGTLTATTTHEWAHGLGELMTALLARGLRVTAFEEHRSVPWEALPGRMRRDDDGEFRLVEHPERLPLSYTLQAVAPGPASRGPVPGAPGPASG